MSITSLRALARWLFVIVALPLAGFGAPAAYADDPLMPYGPDTCIDGYVWREITFTDHVCVTPETREVHKIRSAEDLHRDLNHPELPICQEGYVPHLFVAQDVACITPQQLQQIADDNAQAERRKVINHLPAQRREHFAPQELLGRCGGSAKGAGCNHIFIIRDPKGPVREPIDIYWVRHNCTPLPGLDCDNLYIEMTNQEWDDFSL